MAALAACASGGSAASSGIPALAGEQRDSRGVRFIDAEIGSGEVVVDRRCATVHYAGWLKNGTPLENSRTAQPPEPVSFVVGSKMVMEGWEIGVEGMRVGGKRRLFIPSRLAYGERGRLPQVPPRAELVFDIEVMSAGPASGCGARAR